MGRETRQKAPRAEIVVNKIQNKLSLDNISDYKISDKRKAKRTEYITHSRPFSVSNPPRRFFISDTDADSDGVNSNGMVRVLPKSYLGVVATSSKQTNVPTSEL